MKAYTPCLKWSCQEKKNRKKKTHRKKEPVTDEAFNKSINVQEIPTIKDHVK